MKRFILLLLIFLCPIISSAYWEELSGGLKGDSIIYITKINNFKFIATNQGLFQSTDNLYKYKQIFLDPKIDSLNYFQNINFIGFHKNRLFVTTEKQGFFYSDDFGKTWKMKALGMSITRVKHIEFVDSNLIICTSTGLYYSYDFGESFVKYETGFSKNASMNNTFKFKNKLYLVTYSSGVFTSIDNGVTWQSKPDNLKSKKLEFVGISVDTIIIKANETYYYTVDQAETWNIYNFKHLTKDDDVLHFKISSGVYFIRSQFKGYMLSYNMGKDWIDIDHLFNEKYFLSAVLIDNDRLFIGTNSNGLFLSEDSSKTFVDAVQSIWRNNSMNTNAYYLNSFACYKGNLYAGTESNGIWISTDNGTRWNLSNSSLSKKYISCLKSKDSLLFAGTLEDNFYVSSDSGKTWKNRSSGLQDFKINTILVTDTCLMIGSDGQGVYISFDHGFHWTKRNTGLNDSLQIVDLIETDNGIFLNNIYAIFLSTDNGQTWNRRSKPYDLVPICFNYSNDKLFLGTNNGIYYSEDKADTWIKCSEGIPNKVKINKIGFANGCLFAASDNAGIFVSLDRGKSWKKINEGLQEFTILNIDYDSTYIYATTNKVYRARLDNFIVESADDIVKQSKELVLFPNPAYDKIFINDIIENNKNSRLILYNSLGEFLGEYSIENLKCGLDISTLIKGLYFIKINNSLYKFMKE